MLLLDGWKEGREEGVQEREGGNERGKEGEGGEREKEKKEREQGGKMHEGIKKQSSKEQEAH